MSNDKWVMVPVEPTAEMLAATSWPNCAATDYAHMLAAAPQVPAAPDVAGLVEALEEIIDPIRFMEERLEEGERLNGMAAVQLAGDASYLRGIARAVLAAHRKQQETNHDNQ